jgi:hypothetical protein
MCPVEHVECAPKVFRVHTRRQRGTDGPLSEREQELPTWRRGRVMISGDQRAGTAAGEASYLVYLLLDPVLSVMFADAQRLSGNSVSNKTKRWRGAKGKPEIGWDHSATG